MKLKNIIKGLLILLIPIPNYLLLKEYQTLNLKDFTNLINNEGYGILLMVSFICTCITIIAMIASLIIDNWNKTITLNSIIKSIKTIKLN